MRAPAPLLNVPPKLYKHFAVLTVAVTACVAIFADGENRELIKHEIQVRQERKAVVETRFAGRQSNKRMVEGMQDNRTSAPPADVVESNPGPYDPSPVEASGAEPMGPGTELAALNATDKPRSLRARKLPSVLPPGAPGRLVAQSGQTPPATMAKPIER